MQNVVERPVTTIRHTCAVEGGTSPRKLEDHMLHAAGRRVTINTLKSVVLDTTSSVDMLQEDNILSAVERPVTTIRPISAVMTNTL